MPDVAERSWACPNCLDRFAFLSERARHLATQCEVADPPTAGYDHVIELRCASARPRRRQRSRCARLLMELGRAQDGELAVHTWLMRGRQVSAVKEHAAGEVLERLGVVSQAESGAWLLEHDGEQPQEPLDMGWLRLDDCVFDHGLTGIGAVCPRHGVVQVHRAALRLLAYTGRRTEWLDVTERLVGYGEDQPR